MCAGSLPSVGGKEKRKPRSWFWVTLPVNAGVQGFSTVLPLYVLYQLGGTVIDVALLTTLYNFVVIPASIFWGGVTDRLARRRLFFFITYGGISVVFVGMFFTPSLLLLAVLYGLLGFVIVANSAASNLLVMEFSEKKSWMSSYTRLSLTASLGSIVGLVVGLFWSSFLPLPEFLLFCAASTVASFLLTYFLVVEPSVPLERIHLSFHPLDLFSKLYHGVSTALGTLTGLILVPFTPRELMRFIRAVRAGAIPGRLLLFFSTFLFTLGSGILNTPLTPYLVNYGVLANEIFAMTLINVCSQTLVYRTIRLFTSRLGEVRAGSYAIMIRTVMYVLFAIAALGLRGTTLFVFTTIVYSIIGILYALWNSSTSIVLFNNLGPEKQGGLLGAYSAFSSLGSVLGALVSGYTSYYLGYSLTFALAAVVLLSSFFVLEASFRNLGLSEGTSHVKA